MNEEQTENIEICRFDPKQEKKLMTILDKALNRTDTTSEEMAINADRNRIVNPEHTILIIALSEEAKRLISRYVPEVLPRIPSLDYTDQIGDSDIDVGYLSFAINLFEVTSDTQKNAAINIKAGKDMPLIMTNHHFKIIIAPRLENA